MQPVVQAPTPALEDPAAAEIPAKIRGRRKARIRTEKTPAMSQIQEVTSPIVRAQRRQRGNTLENRVANAFRAYFAWAVEEDDLFEVFRRNAGVIALMPDREPLELGISELLEDLAEWAADGEVPDAEDGYLATAAVGMGFQVATTLLEKDPPDIEGATRLCTRMFMGGLKALAED